jgi:predicted enzyme related to lactoylglutathione lyase
MDGLVKGLVWVGSRTEHYGQMVRFYRDALGLPLEHEEGEFALFRLPDGSKAEVFGPSDTEHTHFTTGPVVGFLVDDVESARGSLEAQGIEFIGPVHEWEPTGRRGRTTEPLTATSTRLPTDRNIDDLRWSVNKAPPSGGGGPAWILFDTMPIASRQVLPRRAAARPLRQRARLPSIASQHCTTVDAKITRNAF